MQPDLDAIEKRLFKAKDGKTGKKNSRGSAFMKRLRRCWQGPIRRATHSKKQAGSETGLLSANLCCMSRMLRRIWWMSINVDAVKIALEGGRESRGHIRPGREIAQLPKMSGKNILPEWSQESDLIA
jgi:hypothetical protein